MKKLPWIGLLLLGFCTSIFADDLALISIDSEEKAELARQVCGSAFLRQEDRFLVSLDDAKLNQLTRAGIDVSIVATNIDLTNLAICFPDPSGARRLADISQLGRAIQLDDGARLVQVGAASVTAIQEETGLKIGLLKDWQTAIEFVQPRIYLNLQADSYPTDSLASKVNQDSLVAYDQKLEAFYTRYIWSDSINKARDWMVQKLQSWGYTNVTTPTFSYGGGIHFNVMAVKAGYAEPNSYVVVGGHYDSYNTQSPGVVYAPGADDDGSGTALTLELARVFRNVPTRKSIIFMPFSAEEEGLVGSYAAAAGFKNSGTNIECMFNFDMVAYVSDIPWGLNLSSGGNTAYRQIAADAAVRLTTIVPFITSMGSSSDHYSFYQQGFDIVDHIEHNFNYDGWHTNIDLSSRLNFSYFTQVAKIAIAEVAIIANAGLPGRIDKVIDNGDGASVTVYLANCKPGSTYWVFHGATSSVLTDSVPVAAGECSVVVGGLTEGQLHYFGVFEKPADGYRSIWSGQASQIPLLYPRAPRALALDPQAAQIGLNWRNNLEADLDHYLIYRRVEGIGDWRIIGTTASDTSFVDAHIVPQIPYLYGIVAVDHDGHESAMSLTARAYAATFDGGPAIVDEFLHENYTQPTQPQQLAWYDSLMGNVPYGVVVCDSSADTLHRADLARFSSAIWVDDDIYMKLLLSDSPQVNWFLSHGANMLIAGYRTIDKNATSPVPSNHVLKSKFGLSTFEPFVQADFQGAKGQLGWPDVQIDQARGAWTLNYVSKLVGVAGTTVIYRYDSETDDPVTEDQPCGIAWDSPNGKRVLLAFPLWNLTPATSKALVAKALQFFGESGGGTVNGDMDASGGLDIADLTMLIDYLYISLTPPTVLAAADMDQSCNVDISDVTYLIAYLFLNGPPPMAPCGG